MPRRMLNKSRFLEIEHAGFLSTSVISGFLVAWGGMVATLAFALVLTFLAFVHLTLIQIRETLWKLHTTNPTNPIASTSEERLRRLLPCQAFLRSSFCHVQQFPGDIFMALSRRLMPAARLTR